MKANLYFLNYNNFFNKTVKKERFIEDYIPYMRDPYFYQKQINFIPNDEITASQIVDWNDTTATPDYLVVTDEYGDIYSRWFVIDWTRTRTGQYEAKLYRDVVADNWNSIITAPAFIEKATLSENNPLIFNKEGAQFNQIKKAEALLKDASNCAWIVGYYDSSVEPQTITGGFLATDLEEYETWNQFYQAYPEYNPSSPLNNLYMTNGATRIETLYALTGGGAVIKQYVVSEDGAQPYLRSAETGGTPGISTRTGSVNTYFNNLYTDELRELLLEASNATNDPTYIRRSKKYVKIAGELRYLDYVQSNTTLLYNPSSTQYINLFSYLTQFIANTGQFSGVPNSNTFSIIEPLQQYNFTAKLTDEIAYDNFTIEMSNIIKLNDAPYSMFAIPYDNPELAYGVAMAFAKQLQTGQFLYDLQLVPFCPLDDPAAYEDHEYVWPIKDSQSQATIGEVYQVKNSSFSRIIPVPSNFNTLKEHLNNVLGGDLVSMNKLDSECNMYRLCSPNYANYEVFVPAMNNGVDYFEVNATYKPYTPFIQVHINFKGLYGSDFNDNRGLILGGDFSLPLITDQWKQYEIQNKNYQAIFDRGIDNTQLTQKWQKREAIWGAVTGAVGGSLSGAMAGGISGGPWGAVAGGVIGGGAGIGSGIADIAKINELQREEISYASDIYNYNLQNIQALPNGLARTSAFNINNKLFPYIEYYTCTDEEIKNFNNALKYGGMTVGKIDTLEPYLIKGSFIKARLIKQPNLSDDAHMANTIATVLANGIYMEVN